MIPVSACLRKGSGFSEKGRQTELLRYGRVGEGLFSWHVIENVISYPSGNWEKSVGRQLQ